MLQCYKILQNIKRNFQNLYNILQTCITYYKQTINLYSITPDFTKFYNRLYFWHTLNSSKLYNFTKYFKAVILYKILKNFTKYFKITITTCLLYKNKHNVNKSWYFMTYHRMLPLHYTRHLPFLQHNTIFMNK